MKRHKKETSTGHPCDQKIKELEEGWKRTQADFENYRKRTEEQRGEVLKMMKADFLAKIAPVLDNFRRAFNHSPDDEFSRGVKQIEKQLSELLASEGLERLNVNVGEKFDCNFHEAISCEENDKVPVDHIIAEVESGWKFMDKVIKPAKVRVSKGK